MVAMNVWPTDAADGSVSSEARWRKMARYWAPTGVLVGQGGDMLPTLAFPNLTVKAGACWVDGHYCELPGDQVLAVTANGLAVVRFDPAANTAQLLYLDGVSVPAQSPTGIYELPIALITGSALVDRRTPVVLATPGSEMIYSQITANVSVTATTQAGAQTVINPGNVTYDGQPIIVEFFAAQLTSPAVAGGGLVLNLWDANTDLGVFGQVVTPAASAMTASATLRRRLTPTPGAHNYNVRGWVTPSGTGIVGAGLGAGVGNQPAYLRTTRA